MSSPACGRRLEQHVLGPLETILRWMDARDLGQEVRAVLSGVPGYWSVLFWSAALNRQRFFHPMRRSNP